MTYKAGTKLIYKDGQFKTRTQHLMDDIANTLFWVFMFGAFFYCLFA